jgi:glycerophosphoryl diester phosphodiesterase
VRNPGRGRDAGEAGSRRALASVVLSVALMACDGERLPVVPPDAVIAHRGFSAVAPEHSLVAHEAARAVGADYLELDVQRSADGVLVLFHDGTPARVTNAASVFPGREHDPIGSFSFAELSRLDLGTAFNQANPTLARPAFSGTRITTLAAALELALRDEGNAPGLFIEAKASELYPGIEAEIVDAVRASGLLALAEEPDFRTGDGTVRVGRTSARLVFHSFSEESLAHSRELLPAAVRLLTFTVNAYERRGLAALAGAALNLDAGLGPSRHASTAEDIADMHRRGHFVHAWTVDDEAEMRTLLADGVDGLFTNHPERWMQVTGREPHVDIGAWLDEQGL